MKKKVMNEDGSTLVLLVIIVAAVILMGTSLLNITMSQLKVKQSNSEIKRAFYISESGLNSAYLRLYDLICLASIDSVNKADEYISAAPGDIEGASNLFENSYKLYIINNIGGSVYDCGNPHTYIVNKEKLSFIGGMLTVKVNSKYVSESGIERNAAAAIIILVPDYSDTKVGATDFTSLLRFNSFNF